MDLQNAQALTYLVTGTEKAKNLTLQCSDGSTSHFGDSEQLDVILSNLKAVYKGEIIPKNGMAVLEAREYDIPLIVAKPLEDGIYSIEILDIAGQSIKTNIEVDPNDASFNIEMIERFALLKYEEFTTKLLNDVMADGKAHTEAQAGRLMNVSDTIYYLVNETYSEDEIKFFTAAKRSTVEENLSNGEAYQQNYDLFDDVINALDPSINMGLVDKAEPLGWEVDGELDNGRAHQIRDLKEEVITLLALKAATTNRINKLVNKMIEISAKRKNGIH